MSRNFYDNNLSALNPFENHKFFDVIMQKCSW